MISDREFTKPAASLTAVAPDCTMIIFGASGDLTKRLLFPSLCSMAKNAYLPKKIAILGVAQPAMTDEAFREYLGREIKDLFSVGGDNKCFTDLLGGTGYQKGDFLDQNLYQTLKSRLADAGKYPQNLLFYLATPPQFFGPVVEQLHAAGLLEESKGSWRRVIIEKPFGRDLASARALNTQLSKLVPEEQIFRIDHYLGKETVQNILVFRFLNGMFEPIWNRNNIDHVQITVSEELGVEGRAGYYEGAGALRDMVQNHLFQLVSLAAMEPPNSVAADSVRDEKVEVLQAVNRFSEEDIRNNVIRGQYARGGMDGGIVNAYRQEPGVSPTSTAETFVAMKLSVENWRWAGVPFYLRTGKRLNQKLTEIAVQFRKAPATVLRNAKGTLVDGNWLLIRIQPDEGISLEFRAKRPGPRFDTSRVRMNFNYSEYFEPTKTTGYETLLFDAMIGDRMLFQRADSVEEGWEIVQPILDFWSAQKDSGLLEYPAGSWGPREADELIRRDGRVWRHSAD